MHGTRRSWALLIAGGVAITATLAAQTPGAAPATQPAAGTMIWKDHDGNPLPFRSDEELLEFLRTADVESAKKLSGGITFPTKLLLAKDGLRVDAIFRDVNESRNTPIFGGGRGEMYFRDSYIYEPAAYYLSRLLGLNNVPPAAIRKYKNEKGSVQIWVEHAVTDKAMGHVVKAPDPVQWNKQLQMMNVFDALIYNTDRNSGNLLIAPNWKLWLIDHTRAFRRLNALPEGVQINQCERGFYEKLKGLNEDSLHELLKPYLSTYEFEGLWKRRNLILERLDKLIAEKGENQVLYDYVFTPQSPPPQPPGKS